jgi:hypothetical protein
MTLLYRNVICIWIQHKTFIDVVLEDTLWRLEKNGIVLKSEDGHRIKRCLIKSKYEFYKVFRPARKGAAHE